MPLNRKDRAECGSHLWTRPGPAPPTRWHSCTLTQTGGRAAPDRPPRFETWHPWLPAQYQKHTITCSVSHPKAWQKLFKVPRSAVINRKGNDVYFWKVFLTMVWSDQILLLYLFPPSTCTMYLDKRKACVQFSPIFLIFQNKNCIS